MKSTSDSELRAAFDGIFTRMLKAGWLKDFRFTQGKGFHLRWTESGGLAALDLKEWIDALSMDQEDNRPMAGHVVAYGGSLFPAGNRNSVDQFLANLRRVGWASSVAVTDDGSQIAWTAAGIAACDRWVARTTQLGIGIDSDTDTLLVLVHAVSQWAPNARTRIQFG